MRQLTQQQALAFYDSDIWHDWTDEQVVALQMFQKFLCIHFERFHAAVEAVLGRGIYLAELGALNYPMILREYLSLRPELALDEILAAVPADKLIAIQLGDEPMTGKA